MAKNKLLYTTKVVSEQTLQDFFATKLIMNLDLGPNNIQIGSSDNHKQVSKLNGCPVQCLLYTGSCQGRRSSQIKSINFSFMIIIPCFKPFRKLCSKRKVQTTHSRFTARITCTTACCQSNCYNSLHVIFCSAL